jgi:hypothetical protein
MGIPRGIRPNFWEDNVKWPKPVKHRNKVFAKIYRKSDAHQFYRAVYAVDGKRMMKSFARYSGDNVAKKWAEEKAAELAKGSREPSLNNRQANDALATIRALQRFYEVPGSASHFKRESPRIVAPSKGRAHTSSPECVERFLATVAVVKRKDIAEAVADFIDGRKHLAEAKDGKRSKRSRVYAYNVATPWKMWLNPPMILFPFCPQSPPLRCQTPESVTPDHPAPSFSGETGRPFGLRGGGAPESNLLVVCGDSSRQFPRKRHSPMSIQTSGFT